MINTRFLQDYNTYKKGTVAEIGKGIFIELKRRGIVKECIEEKRRGRPFGSKTQNKKVKDEDVITK